MTHYIEDILQLVVDNASIEESDLPIMHSISRQLKKGIALTDRQYELINTKIQKYKNHLLNYNCEIGNQLPTRLPLRSIDRSKTIEIVSHADMVGSAPYESYKQNWAWIKVRFPFSKKLIAKLDSIKIGNTSVNKYHHNKGSHEHYFRLNGDVLVKLVNAFKNSNFEITETVLDYYHKSADIIENQHLYITEYRDNQFFNVNSDALNQLSTFSDPLLIADRRIRYGYKTNFAESDQTLAEKIAFRKTQNVNIDPNQYSLAELAQAIVYLQRFPLLVLIDQDNSYEQLKAFHNAFESVDNKLQSVLFRIEKDDIKNNALNQYVKDHNLNNWVDNQTQIVYIKKAQLPKVLFDSGFAPIASVSITSYRSNSNVDAYCKFHCDLMICHDKEQSIFGSKFGTYSYA